LFTLDTKAWCQTQRGIQTSKRTVRMIKGSRETTKESVMKEGDRVSCYLHLTHKCLVVKSHSNIGESNQSDNGSDRIQYNKL
jgi:uncharacterized protein (DUF1499 family)